ncbi:MAG: phenylalanine--tRNA ligase beta subunit-related protein [Microthrixaceae bacterium]|nr:phenylalanine--tRNA ligase beta subunit-related protein [Microthrixaceae bacterium]
MGGASTEISADTSDILLELAWWDPMDIARSSGSLNLHSEASLRFKRGVDTEIAPLAGRRFAELLGAVTGATLHPGTIDERGDLPERDPLTVRTDRGEHGAWNPARRRADHRADQAHRVRVGTRRRGSAGEHPQLAPGLLRRGRRHRGDR